MKIIFATLLIAATSLCMAQTKDNVNSMLDQLQKSGSFTPEQIEIAKKQLMGMDPSKFEGLVNQAKQKSADPELQKKALEIYKKSQGRLPATK